jgi:uncharacterized phage protein (TIGR01671 family)
MRDIKFRAWDKKHNRFLGDDFLIGDDGKIFFVQFGNEIYLAVQEQYIIEQFTGLSDKNGKEIYEGDILKVYFHYDGDYFTKEQLCAVVFEEAEFYGKPFKNKGIQNSFYEALNQKEIIEIIGNIHENPELLK